MYQLSKCGDFDSPEYLILPITIIYFKNVRDAYSVLSQLSLIN